MVEESVVICRCCAEGEGENERLGERKGEINRLVKQKDYTTLMSTTNRYGIP